MAVSSGRPQRLAVYQAGRGHEPVVVAANGTFLVAVKAMISFPLKLKVHSGLDRASAHAGADRLALAETTSFLQPATMMHSQRTGRKGDEALGMPLDFHGGETRRRSGCANETEPSSATA